MVEYYQEDNKTSKFAPLASSRKKIILSFVYSTALVYSIFLIFHSSLSNVAHYVSLYGISNILSQTFIQSFLNQIIGNIYIITFPILITLILYRSLLKSIIISFVILLLTVILTSGDYFLLLPIYLAINIFLAFLVSIVIGLIGRRLSRLESRSLKKVILIVPFLIVLLLLSVNAYRITTFSIESCEKALNSQTEYQINLQYAAQECYKKVIQERSLGTTACEQVKDKFAKDLCYKSVASVTNISQSCAVIIDNDQKSECYQQAGISKLNSSLCDLAPIQGYKDQCYKYVGTGTKDETLCQKIADNFTKESCFAWVARAKNDPSLCHGENSCYFDIALATRNVIICNAISYEPTRNECIQSFEQ